MDEIIRLQRATVDEHIRQEDAHQWPAVYDTFIQTDAACLDVVPLNIRFGGVSGVKDFYAALEAAFPDFHVSVWAEYDLPGCSVREMTVEATHKGEWCGLAPTGKRVKVHVAVLYLFGTGPEAGKLLAERIYFDNQSLMQQMRGELNPDSVADFSKTLRQAVR